MNNPLLSKGNYGQDKQPYAGPFDNSRSQNMPFVANPQPAAGNAQLGFGFGGQSGQNHVNSPNQQNGAAFQNNLAPFNVARPPPNNGNSARVSPLHYNFS